MKFELVPDIEGFVMKTYISDGELNNAAHELNNSYKGWIYVENMRNKSLNQIYLTYGYRVDGYDVKILCGKYSVGKLTLETIQNSEDVKVEDYISDDELYYDDTIYKIREIEDEPEISKIRWYKKGKFESMKTFEGFNEGIKWYSKGKFEPAEEIDIKDRVYDDFITDDEFRQFLIDYNCYDEYIENCSGNFKKNFALQMKGDYIGAAFPWGHSLSGNKFWEEMNEKWNSIIYKHKYGFSKAIRL